MKKYLVIIFSFMFLLFANSVEAKTVGDSEVVVSFGNGDRLDLAYTEINSFKIGEDKSFYFNGVKHHFNDDYTLVDSNINVSNNSFEMEDDTFTLNLTDRVVTSNKKYITYMFDVSVDILEEKTYTFTQEICYQYQSNNVCHIDSGDIQEINRDQSMNYYYDFFPFYKESIIFDSISYKFTFNDGNKDIKKEVSFNSDEINYKDSFKIMAYPGQYSNYYYSSYKGKDYVNLSNGYMYFNVDSFNSFDTTRNYDFNFYICLGDDYSNCKKLNEEVMNITTLSNVSTSSLLNLNLYSYLYENNELKYKSFKLKADYIYKSGDDIYSRRQNVLTSTNEVIYYVSESTPYFKGELNGTRISCGYSTCYGANSEVTNKLLFEDDNGINKVYYLISKEQINDVNLINIEVNNGSEITFGSDLEGTYYFYIRVFDNTGIYSSNLSSPYQYLFDKKGPSLSSDNFSEYDSEGVYGDVNIIVRYSDDNFNAVSGIYYKVIKESEYASVTKQDIISHNVLYENGVNIKDYVNEDGLYRVCFVSYDYLNNYTAFDKLVDCSAAYYIDVSALNKNEVSVSSVVDGYLSELNLTISISGVDENEKFKCGLFKSDVSVNEMMLTSECYNKVNNNLNFLGEGEYKLWIYASDSVGNYGLVELDNIYYLDNLQPRINYIISGDNNVYSNSVKLSVSVVDLNDIASSSYLFYQDDYTNKEFTDFDLDKEISYPYNYYGEYKVAIKVCDSINNCSISAQNQTFKIDTGEIKLELIGDSEVVILRFGKYKEKGISMTKGINNTKVNLEYSISGDVDTSKVGEYLVTYTSGSGMNETSIVRKVIVKDSMPYIYAIVVSLVVGELIILARLFIKKRKNDSI